jgi:hypothetical protein
MWFNQPTPRYLPKWNERLGLYKKSADKYLWQIYSYLPQTENHPDIHELMNSISYNGTLLSIKRNKQFISKATQMTLKFIMLSGNSHRAAYHKISLIQHSKNGKMYWLIVVLVAPCLYAFVKIHRTIHLTKVNFIICNLYLNKLSQTIQWCNLKATKSLKCIHPWAGDVAQWLSTCLTCARPWVQSPALQKMYSSHT